MGYRPVACNQHSKSQTLLTGQVTKLFITSSLSKLSMTSRTLSRRRSTSGCKENAKADSEQPHSAAIACTSCANLWLMTTLMSTCTYKQVAGTVIKAVSSTTESVSDMQLLKPLASASTSQTEKRQLTGMACYLLRWRVCTWNQWATSQDAACGCCSCRALCTLGTSSHPSQPPPECSHHTS